MFTNRGWFDCLNILMMILEDGIWKRTWKKVFGKKDLEKRALKKGLRKKDPEKKA